MLQTISATRSWTKSLIQELSSKRSSTMPRPPSRSEGGSSRFQSSATGPGLLQRQDAEHEEKGEDDRDPAAAGHDPLMDMAAAGLVHIAEARQQAGSQKNVKNAENTAAAPGYTIQFA